MSNAKRISTKLTAIIIIAIITAGAAGGGYYYFLMQRPGPKELVVLGWGGTWYDALNKWVIQPYEKENNVKVVFQSQSVASESQARVRAEKDKPTIDVWLTTGSAPLLLAQDNMLVELTTDGVPNERDLIPVTIGQYNGKTYWVGIHLFASDIAADKDAVKRLIPDYNKDMLKSWKFMYRPEFANKIKFGKFMEGDLGRIIGVTMPYGGSITNFDRVIEVWKSLAPNIHMFGTTADDVALLKQKEIVAANGNPVSAKALFNMSNIDIGVPQDPMVVSLDWVVAIKNGPAGPDLALKFINKLIDTKVQENYVAQLGLNSPNGKATQPVYPFYPGITTDDYLKRSWTPDYLAQIKNWDAWNERWQKEIVPLAGKGIATEPKPLAISSGLLAGALAGISTIGFVTTITPISIAWRKNK